MSGLLKKTILLLLLICPAFVMADDGYIIKNFNIDIVVNKDNTFDITEEIYTDFYEEKHGIIRTLPIINEVERLDNSYSSNYAKLSNVSCNMNFELSKTKYNYEIKIGDADKTLTGDNLIIIKYTYDIGKDPLKDADEFYYNIIGTDWSASIQNANFAIHFPKEGIEEIGFSCGGYGTIGPGCVEWQLKDNKTIIGQINRELYTKEGVTIRVTLPEGYFERTEFRSEIIIIWMAILIGFFAISLYIKNKNSVVEVVEFYPPENLTGLDCQAILKPSSVDNSTTMSLAFSLANKGYIKIIDEEFGYKMHKIKDYDGSNKEEKMFMKALFKEKNEITYEDVNTGNLNLMMEFSKINSYASNKVENNYRKPNYTIALYMALLSLIWVLYAMCLVARINVFTILIVVITHVMLYHCNANNFAGKIVLAHDFLIYLLMFMLFMYTLHNYNFISVTELSCIARLVLFADGIMILLFAAVNNNLNEEYSSLKGRVQGFKNFLIAARKDELELLVEDNPYYFYDILPYTMALNISDVWVDKFKCINIVIPEVDWYIGDDIDNTRFKVEIVTTPGFGSTPERDTDIWDISDSSSSHGSGGSNGGFSGGGSGGGGGRSW